MPFSAIIALFADGYALSDILTELSSYCSRLVLPQDAKMVLLDKLSDVEYRLAFGTNERVQAAAMVAAFEFAREKMSDLKKAGKA